MQKIYSYLGKSDAVNMLSEAFQAALEQRGYTLEVDVGAHISPRVHQFVKESTVISMSVDETAGEKWESAITLETEEADEDVSAAVAEAVRRLLADVSTRLIESVTDAATKAKIVDDLCGVLASLK